MSVKYTAVIFDLDGVLCHTDRCHFAAWKRMSDELGVRFNEKTNNRLRGVGRMQSLEIILKENGRQLCDEEKQHCAARKNDYYCRMLDDMTPEDIDPDVRRTLDEIRRMGIKTAIGSSSKNAKRILKKTGLSGYFDAVSDGTNITKPKPDPEVFLKASRYVGIAPDCCLVVEDAQSGIDAALAAGMDCAAIGDAVSYGIATYNLQKLSDILQYLK